MTKFVEINRLRPNNWYLDRKKLERIRGIWSRGEQNSLPNILVVTIEDDLSLIDGHCRAFVAWENGADGIASTVVRLDEISGIQELYVIFHRQGLVLGIRNVWDLGDKIYDLEETTDPDIAVLIADV